MSGAAAEQWYPYHVLFFTAPAGNAVALQEEVKQLGQRAASLDDRCNMLSDRVSQAEAAQKQLEQHAASIEANVQQLEAKLQAANRELEQAQVNYTRSCITIVGRNTKRRACWRVLMHNLKCYRMQGTESLRICQRNCNNPLATQACNIVL